jgi:phosphoserine phosphatase
VGNRLEVIDGKLTGGLVGPISDSATKKATLLEEHAKLGGKVPTWPPATAPTTSP